MDEEAKKMVDLLRGCGECNRECKYYNKCYKTGCDSIGLELDAAAMIERQSEEIDELREKLGEARLGAIWYKELGRIGELLDENANLRDQVHNLTMYLLDAIENLDEFVRIVNNKDECRFTKAFYEDFDGMPGYNPAILKDKSL